MEKSIFYTIKLKTRIEFFFNTKKLSGLKSQGASDVQLTKSYLNNQNR